MALSCNAAERYDLIMKKETLDHLRQCQIKMLDELDRICKAHQLRYYLMYGTLIGAVRHQGYIPWDDDIDVVMPKKDYKEFLRIAAKELPAQYFLQTPETDKYHARFFAKIRMNNTAFVSKEDQNSKKHHGIFIDILPLYYTNRNLSRSAVLRRKIASAFDGSIILRRENKTSTQFRYLFLHLLPTSLLVKLREKLYDCKGDCYTCFGYLHEISDFDPPKELLFEGKKYPVPGNYDKVLREIYGDYMQLPPPDKRVTHNPARISFDLNGPDEDLTEQAL